MIAKAGLGAAGAILALSAALLAPAFWNGYPLFYFDSLDYISLPYTWKIPIFRTAGYGVMSAVVLPFNSVWAIVVAQSIAVAYILFEARRVLLPELSPLNTLGTLGVLLMFTGLPWLSSTVMPDVFTVPAVLLTIMLAQTETPLGPARRAIFMFILTLALAAHPTHIALCIGLAICIVAIDFFARRGWPFLRLRMRDVIVALILGTAFTIGSNWIASGKFFFTPRTTQVLTLAVMVEKGLVQDYLAETCTDPTARKSILCPYRDRLVPDANEFLWHSDFYHKIGGWPVMIEEADWLLNAVIARYPLRFALNAVELMLEQLVTFKTGEGMRTMVGFLDLEIRTYYAHENPAFMAARQQSYPEEPYSPMEAINRIHLPVLFGSLALIVCALALAWQQRDARALTLAGLMTLAYLGNAFICGAISNPADRYGNRIVWGLALAALVLLPRLIKKAGGRETSSAAD